MNTHKLCMLFFVFMSSFHANPTPKPIRLITKITYYNSFHSPNFNPNATLEDYANDELKISRERLTYFKMLTRNNLSSEKIEIEIIPGGPPRIFFVHLYVGLPRTPQLLVMDTGSSVPWIMCRPYRDDDEQLQVPNLYDPEKSSTYAQDVYCNTFYCINSGDANMCGPLGECNYRVKYPSGWTIGKLGTERFATTDGESLDMVFGCSKYDYLQHKLLTQCNGVLGLGAREISIVKQSGFKKFSYCIGNLYTSVSNHNKLIIGEPLVDSFYSTPLIVDNYHYYVNLEGISVGDKLLDIDPKKLRRSLVDQSGGAVIDTGSTYSYIQSVAYEKLKDEIIILLGGLKRSRFTGREDEYEVCYEGSMRKRLTDFPVVTLHFDQGAKMELSIDNLFLQIDSVYFCFSIANSEKQNFPSTLIGVRLQQFFYTAYDLDSMRVSFQKVDCNYIV